VAPLSTPPRPAAAAVYSTVVAHHPPSPQARRLHPAIPPLSRRSPFYRSSLGLPPSSQRPLIASRKARSTSLSSLQSARFPRARHPPSSPIPPTTLDLPWALCSALPCLALLARASLPALPCFPLPRRGPLCKHTRRRRRPSTTTVPYQSPPLLVSILLQTTDHTSSKSSRRDSLPAGLINTFHTAAPSSLRTSSPPSSS